MTAVSSLMSLSVRSHTVVPLWHLLCMFFCRSDTMSGEGGGKTASKAAARATSSASARGAPAVTVHAMLVLQLAATIILMA